MVCTTTRGAQYARHGETRNSCASKCEGLVKPQISEGLNHTDTQHTPHGDSWDTVFSQFTAHTLPENTLRPPAAPPPRGPRVQRDPQGARAVAAKDLLYTGAKCNLGDTATITDITVRVSRFRLSARLLGLLGRRQEGHRVDGMQRAAICEGKANAGGGQFDS